ncbi:MAG: hypothetical protein GY711_21300 [bacterium]|nr:hypothetical protein [bacterium]
MRPLLQVLPGLLVAPLAFGQWSTASLSVARSDLAATSVGDKALFAGGRANVPQTKFATVDLYDAVTRTWTTASLSVARSRLAAASAGGRAFFAGGFLQGNYESSRVDIYDDATATWSTAELSIGRAALVGASAGNKVFFAGGFPDHTRVDIYDVATDAWSTAELSTPRHDLAATTVGGLVLFGGGWSPSAMVDTVDIFDTGTGAWTTTQLPTPRGYLTAASVAGLALFAGGWVDGDPVEFYDPATATWTGTTLSVPRQSPAGTTVGQRGVFAGGLQSNGVATDRVDLYDAGTQTWSTASLSLARAFAVATSVRGQALFAGGRPWASLGAESRVDIFEPDLGSRYCSPANVNSSGLPGRISAEGSQFVDDQDLTLVAEDLPAGEFGYFLVGSNQGTFQPPGSQGVLCLTCGFQGCSGIGRFNQAGLIIQGPVGSIDVDLTSLPLSPAVAVQPGETWNFQCWFRDQGSNNFTDAISLTFF